MNPRRKQNRKPRTKERISWEGAKNRCYNKNRPGYKYYGGRGIKVCERWLKFENFLADMGPRPTGTTLERVDGNKDYEPGNCIWATPKAQAKNRRNSVFVTIDGVTKTFSEWCAENGINYYTAWGRVRLWNNMALAVTTPLIHPAGRRVKSLHVTAGSK